MPRTPRALALLLGSSLFAGGAFAAAARAPVFTWLNSGLRVEYGASAGAGALVAAAGAALFGWGWARPGRWAALAVALLALALGLHTLRYRLLAEDNGISERGLLGTTTMTWQEVARVEAGTRSVVLWGPGERQVRVDTSTFTPEDRARLDRTIARRVRERTSR